MSEPFSAKRADAVSSAEDGGALLVQLLGPRVGDDRASAMVASALEAAGRSEAPHDADELLAFVRAHLVDDLLRLLGARALAPFLDELEATVRLWSGVRVPRHDEARGLVAIVERDRFAGAALARTLVQRRLDVVVVEQLDQLGGPTSPDVVVVDVAAAASVAIFRVLTVRGRAPAILFRTRGEPDDALRLLERAGVDVYEIMTASAPAELADAVDRLLTRR